MGMLDSTASYISQICADTSAELMSRSLTHPSAQLGLYTIKSTPGLCSRHGIVTGSFYHDTPGPLARSMKDVALILDIISGYDRYDNLTSEARYSENGYTAQVVDKDALRGLKLGLPWYPYWSTIQVIAYPNSTRMIR